MKNPALNAAISEHTKVLEAFFEREESAIIDLATRIANGLDNGNKLLICGNGGSACDAMHIAGEFVGRFKLERKGLPAIALSADSGIITAVGNDYGFDQIFARQVEALGNTDDIFITMSTSGSSPNVLAALETAKEYGLYTILLTGEKGRNRAEADLTLAVDGTNTARIQEVHITLLHLLAELAETQLAERGHAA